MQAAIWNFKFSSHNMLIRDIFEKTSTIATRLMTKCANENCQVACRHQLCNINCTFLHCFEYSIFSISRERQQTKMQKCSKICKWNECKLLPWFTDYRHVSRARNAQCIKKSRLLLANNCRTTHFNFLSAQLAADQCNHSKNSEEFQPTRASIESHVFEQSHVYFLFSLCRSSPLIRL